MTREQIEKAWENYTLCNLSLMDEHAINEMEMFVKGAEWRINSVWHDKNEMPDKEELVLCEILCYNNQKVYLPLQWEADGKMTIDVPFLNKCEVIRWAYLDDLLPDGKDEAE